MSGKSLDLTKGNIARCLILFILPILAGSLIQQLYTTVDAVVVGRFVGKSGLAAIDSVSTLFRFPVNFLSGLAAGATIIISRYFGSKQEEELDCSIHTACTIAIVLGVLFSVIGLVFTPLLLKIMAVPDDIRSMTMAYCRIYFAGLWAMTLYNMVSGILRAFGDSRTPFFILIVCCIVNILGDLLLVGVFHLSVAGAAIATTFSQLVSALLALHALAKTHTHCSKRVWQLHFSKRHIGMMLSIGMPLALQSILFPIANSIIQASINHMGSDTIAAWAICSKLETLIWLIADSLNPALSTYTSQNFGAGRKDRILKGCLLGAFLSFASVGVISILLYFFSGPVGSLFVASADQTSTIPLVVHYMAMMAPFYVFYTFAESFSGSCCGMGDTILPMITTLVCTCGLRVACILFVLPHFRSMECIIWIYIASWIVTGLAFSVMFFFKYRKMRREAPAEIT